MDWKGLFRRARDRILRNLELVLLTHSFSEVSVCRLAWSNRFSGLSSVLPLQRLEKPLKRFRALLGVLAPR